jgi:hypothetical protein
LMQESTKRKPPTWRKSLMMWIQSNLYLMDTVQTREKRLHKTSDHLFKIG